MQRQGPYQHPIVTIEVDDMQAALRTVAEVTGSNSISVAEHVAMMVLSLVRNYLPSHEIAVHGALHAAAIDIDVRLVAAAAVDGAVAVRVNPDRAGGIRRELQQRVAFTAKGNDGAVVFELIDGEGDLLLGHVAQFEAVEDIAHAEQTVAARAEQFDDRCFEIVSQPGDLSARSVRRVRPSRAAR